MGGSEALFPRRQTLGILSEVSHPTPKAHWVRKSWQAESHFQCAFASKPQEDLERRRAAQREHEEGEGKGDRLNTQRYCD